jgi:hypothetical protein
MDSPNEEFRNFVINLYADYRKGGPSSHVRSTRSTRS